MNIKEKIFSNISNHPFWSKLIQKAFFQFHKIAIRLGIHIVPVHYYSPFPDILELEKTQNLWRKESELPGIQTNLDKQFKILKNITSQFKEEYPRNNYLKSIDQGLGQGYSYVDAQVLHSVIRHYKPKKIIEVGSGISTYCALSAMKLNKNNDAEFISIEPFPADSLKSYIKEEKNISLIQKKVQNVPFKLFESLEKNDLLFIDSSHTVKVGSDVNFIILEVLPRLKKGVIIHFHDIFFPFDYHPNTLNLFFHWNETSLLNAFLINNYKFNILFCMNHLNIKHKMDLNKIFTKIDSPTSIYLQKIED